MRALLLAAAAALLAGCAPRPADLLKSTLAIAASTPHSFTGKSTRTVAPVAAEYRKADPLIVSWEVKGSFAAPYAEVTLKGLAGARRSVGSEGWWVEPYEGAWRAYPPPYESVEWLDPGGLTVAEEYGPEQTVGGVACRRILASHPAGRFSFDVAKKDGRLMRVSGATTDGADVHEFELALDWSGGKVDPPEGARVVLGALRGARPTGDDPAARDAVLRAWSVLPRGTSIANSVRIEFLNASELTRRSDYLEQDPPLRVWNSAEDNKQVFIFSDGRRTLRSETPDGPVTELPSAPVLAVDELAGLEVKRASFEGESEHRGMKCRLVAAELKSKKSDAEAPPAVGWFWIAPDGRLARQLIVAKVKLAGEGTREATTVADITVRPDPPEGEMRLMKRAREIFRR